MSPPAAADRTTLPLLRTAALVGLALSAWPAFATGGPRWAWLVAFVVGLLGGLLYPHPYRALGLVPVGLTLGTIAAAAGRVWGWCPYSAGVAGAGCGLAVGVLLDPRTAGRLRDVSGWLIGGLCWAAAGLGLVPAAAVRLGWADPDRVRDTFTVGAAVALFAGAALAWARLFRPAFEMCVATVALLMFRMKWVAPGLAEFPRTGPCLVIANHGCWFDPFFIGKVVPRPVTPLMTSAFYDLPIIRWLMVNVFHTIRVPERPLKQDVPQEIQEAIAALDRGDCVILFPEGYLRRTEEKPMRRFGRGVWQILTARPDTPVYACWIEGAWGTFTSYKGGPPTKNKRLDSLRPVSIALPEPIHVPPEELARHLTCRLALMNRVAASRALLGLPPLPPYGLPERDDEEHASS